MGKSDIWYRRRYIWLIFIFALTITWAVVEASKNSWYFFDFVILMILIVGKFYPFLTKL